MVAGAAGDDQHAADAAEHVAGLGAEQLRADRAAAGDHLQRVGQGLGLLEDLLLHVVAVLAQFDGVGRQRRQVFLAFDRAAVGARHAEAVAAQLGEVAVLEIDHAAGHLQQRGGVGGGIHAVLADAEQQR